MTPARPTIGWAAVNAIGQQLQGFPDRELQALGRELKALAIEHGIRHVLGKNPPLRVRGKKDFQGRGAFVFVGQIGRDVEEIKYIHADDGEPYKHPFEGSAEMFAIVRAGKHDVLLTSAAGLPLWKDFL